MNENDVSTYNGQNRSKSNGLINEKYSKIYPMIKANETKHTKYSLPKLKWDFQFNQNDHKPYESIKRTIKVTINSTN